MRDPEVAPCPAGGELENTIINMKKEDAMQTFYDDTLKHMDPFATLSDRLEGKYLCYGGGVKPLQKGKSFTEGFIMRLADRPDNTENTIISVEPWLNKDGAPQLKMTVYQAAAVYSAPKQMSRLWNGQNVQRQCHAKKGD